MMKRVRLGTKGRGVQKLAHAGALDDGGAGDAATRVLFDFILVLL